MFQDLSCATNFDFFFQIKITSSRQKYFVPDLISCITVAMTSFQTLIGDTDTVKITEIFLRKNVELLIFQKPFIYNI